MFYVRVGAKTLLGTTCIQLGKDMPITSLLKGEACHARKLDHCRERKEHLQCCDTVIGIHVGNISLEMGREGYNNCISCTHSQSTIEWVHTTPPVSLVGYMHTHR